jgi:LPS-assembly protein
MTKKYSKKISCISLSRKCYSNTSKANHIAYSFTFLCSALLSNAGLADNSVLPNLEIRYPNWRSNAENDSNLCSGQYVSLPIKAQENTNTPNQEPYPKDTIFTQSDYYRYEEGKKALFEGQPLFQQNDIQIESDWVELDQAQSEAIFGGYIRFISPETVITADHLIYNTKNHTAQLGNSAFSFPAFHLRGESTNMIRNEDKTIEIHQGFVTSCAPNNDDWMIYGKDIVLDPNKGWGSISHMQLKLNGLPVFYLPYFYFPIDNKRQTGFLYPQITDLGDRDISLPFYFNIHPSVDATYTPRDIQSRGLLHQAEFRYLDPFGTGTLQGTYLDEDDEKEQKSRSSFAWIDQKKWSPQFQTEARFSQISDNDYLDDFELSLYESSLSHLVSDFKLNYHHPWVDVSILAEHYQIIDSSVPDELLPFNRLPEINLSSEWILTSKDPDYGLKPSYSDWEWYIKPDINLASFSQTKNPTNPYIDRLHSQVSMGALQSGLSGFIKPEITLYQTYYQFTQNFETRQENRFLYGFNLDAGLYFDRHDFFRGKKGHQTLEPRLFYLYIPFEDQSNIPLIDTADTTFNFDGLYRENRFTGIDRIGDTHQLSIGLLSRFMDASGTQLGQIHFGQITYFKDREVALNNEIARNNASDFVAGGEMQWQSRLKQQFELKINQETQDIDIASVGFEYKSPQDIIYLGYRFNKATPELQDIDQARLGYVREFNNPWRLMAGLHYDLDQSSALENLFGLEYNACCWQARIIHYQRQTDPNNTDPNNALERDSKLLLQFELRGLSRSRKALDDLLLKTIPGFEQTLYP